MIIVRNDNVIWCGQHNEAIGITYLNCQLHTIYSFDLGRHHPPSLVCIYQPMWYNPRIAAVGVSITRRTPAPAASVHLSADGSSPASAGTPISSNSSSMAIISCRYRVREGIE